MVRARTFTGRGLPLENFPPLSVVIDANLDASASSKQPCELMGVEFYHIDDGRNFPAAFLFEESERRM